MACRLSPHFRVLFATWLLALLSFAPAALAQQVQLDAFPKTGQLVPRAADNLGTIEIAGTVLEAGWAEIVVRTSTRAGLIDEQILPLQYSGGQAAFATSGKIRAGLRDYQVCLSLRGGGGEQIVALANTVVCGDVYLVNGQSNAVALDYWDQGKANQSQSWWVRSFGTSALGSNRVRNNHNWYLAEGARQSAPGAVGTWALDLGARIVAAEGVPVAILNGAVGATPIRWHQRTDDQPADTSNIYGRLLYRARAASLAQHARAMFWYQGEADGAIGQLYAQRFDQLISDWREDYPALEKVYVMQVRQGCGADAQSDVFEAQRQLAVQHPEVELMSTSAQRLHDDCHYRYGGYIQLASQLARLVGRDLYGRSMPDAAQPPDAIAAWRSNATGDQITLEFDAAADGLQVESGAESTFLFTDGAQVQSIQVQGNQLIMQLDRATQSTTLRYSGSVGAGPTIANRLGVGALLFHIELN